MVGLLQLFVLQTLLGSKACIAVPGMYCVVVVVVVVVSDRLLNWAQ
jgi:hypothetical protein